MPALIAALAVTLSRNAWVGACVGIGLLFLHSRLPAARAAAGRARRVHRLRAVATDRSPLLVVPRQTPAARQRRHRGQSASNRDRLAMIRSGLRIIKDDPLTGVGPDMIIQVYAALPRSRRGQAAQPAPAQRAAADCRRARPAGARGLALVHRHADRATFVKRRTGAFRRCRTAALAAMAAMVAAGMFEYNFGDSEFLMLFLVLMTLPYAADRAARRRRRRPHAAARSDLRRC